MPKQFIFRLKKTYLPLITSFILCLFSLNSFAQLKMPAEKRDLFPTAPIVTDDGQFTNNNTQLHATWVPSDPLTILEYQYAIGTSPGAIDVVGWTSTGTATEVTHTGLNLTHNQTYYFSVKSKNITHIWSEKGYSDGIIVDIVAPTITIDNPQDGQYFGP